MEAEALASIFVDEFEQLSESPFHWRVLLEPHAPGDDIENHGKALSPSPRVDGGGHREGRDPQRRLIAPLY